MLNKPLRETPISIIDFETTGLSFSSGARVVEVAVVRVDPPGEPRVILDTLIDPEGPVLCSNIHGITDDDVLGAPRFTDILGEIVLSLEGSIVGAFNASFDMGFWIAEAGQARKTSGLRIPPHVCLMWMRPLIGLSKRCSLDVACQQHGLASGTHRAAEDALACAYMWKHYVDAAEKQGYKTWGELTSAGTHKYLKTLSTDPYSRDDFYSVGGTLCGTAKKPRLSQIVPPTNESRKQEKPPRPVNSKHSYWIALLDAFSDGVIDEAEIDSLMLFQRKIGIQEQAIRDVHVRFYAQFLMVCAEDNIITDEEAGRIRKLRYALNRLGWAP